MDRWRTEDQARDPQQRPTASAPGTGGSCDVALGNRGNPRRRAAAHRCSTDRVGPKIGGSKGRSAACGGHRCAQRATPARGFLSVRKATRKLVARGASRSARELRLLRGGRRESRKAVYTASCRVVTSDLGAAEVVSSPTSRNAARHRERFSVRSLLSRRGDAPGSARDRRSAPASAPLARSRSLIHLL